MMDVNTGINKKVQGVIPTVCTESPAPGKAFCKSHCSKVEELGYPTNLREFLISCSKTKEVVPESYSKDMKKIVDNKVNQISKKIDTDSLKIKSSTDAQGTSSLLRSRAFKEVENFEMDGEGNDCNK